jgi:arsenate reductase
MEKEALDKLASLAHPQRLALFRLLMRRLPQAVPAGELAEALNLPRSTLSPYLSSLTQAGLISQERAGTSLLYRAEPDGAGQLIAYLSADCCRARPEVCLPVTQPLQGAAMTNKIYNVLFLCTGNSARSIFAETLLRAEAPERFSVYSAGTHPRSELNPFAVELLQAKGHDITPLRAKHMSEFWAEGAPVMDFVFTVCDNAANEDCPAWTGKPITGHWGQPDPVKATGTDAEKRLAFQQVYGALRNRIRAFAALPFETLDRASLQARVDDLAQTKD